MWIEKLENGKFKAVERYEDYFTGKQKRVSITIDKNTPQERKKAQDALNRKIEKKLSSAPKKKSELTFERLIEEYRADQLETVKISTYKRNFHACNTFMNIFGRDTLMSRFNAKFIRDRLIATKKTPGTLNEHITRLKALLRWGYKNELIEDISYLDKLEPFKDKPHKEKIQDKYLEGDEVKELLKIMSVEKWRDFTEFLVLSGLRPGEAIALEYTDVDLKERIIHVNKTYDANNLVVTTPKTSCSIRDIYIQDELLEVCKRIKKKSSKEVFIFGPILFFHDHGDYLKYYAYKKYLRENVLKITDKIITPHALRHTHASLLMEKGIDVDTISRRLGHESSKITKEIYLHVTEKLKEKDFERISAIKIL